MNAIRMVTKNILAILMAEQRTVDWYNQYLIVPLAKPMVVSAGDYVTIQFDYEPGAALDALGDSLQVNNISQLEDLVAL